MVYADAGGGHRAAARTLSEVLQTHRGHRVTWVNPYREVLADLDAFALCTPLSGEDVYNQVVVERGWNRLFCWAYYGVVAASTWVYGAEGARRFRSLWRSLAPDLVISVIPLMNQVLLHSTRLDGHAVPFAVLMTDLQEMTRGSWLPPGGGYHALVGTHRAQAQARDAGLGSEEVHPLGGMLVHPRFDPEGFDPADERRRMGLDPRRPTGVMLYGGSGSPRMRELAAGLPADTPSQWVFLAGRNESLARELRGADLSYPHVVVGYTEDVPRYLAAADFLVGKPGPGFLSEAMAMERPVLLDRSAALPQERYNLRFALDEGLGRTFRSVRGLRRAVEALLDGGLPALRPACAGRRNESTAGLLAAVDAIFAGQATRSGPSATGSKGMTAAVPREGGDGSTLPMASRTNRDLNPRT